MIIFKVIKIPNNKIIDYTDMLNFYRIMFHIYVVLLICNFYS